MTSIATPLVRGPGTSGRLVIGGPPLFEFIRGYLSTELAAPESQEFSTSAAVQVWDYDNDNDWVEDPNDKGLITIVNHDPSLTGSVGAFVIAMKWYTTRPDNSLYTEWVPIWVGCPIDG